MTEDVFHIVVTATVALTALAFVVEAGVVIAFYRGFRRTQVRVVRLIGEVQPVLAKVEPMLDRIGPVTKSLNAITVRMRPVIDKVPPAIEKAGRVIDRVGRMADKVGMAVTTANRIVDDARPQIKSIAEDVAAISKSGREQVKRLLDLLQNARERVRTRLAQIDQTVEHIEQVGDTVKRATMRRLKEVYGLAAGISAAVLTLVHRLRVPRQDRQASPAHAGLPAGSAAPSKR